MGNNFENKGKFLGGKVSAGGFFRNLGGLWSSSSAVIPPSIKPGGEALPFVDDLQGAYFVEGGQVLDDRVTSPYADDAMLVNSYCVQAVFNLTGGRERLSSSDDWFKNIGTNNLEFEFEFEYPTMGNDQFGALLGCTYLGPLSRWGIITFKTSSGVNELSLAFSINSSGGLNLNSNASFTAGNSYKCKVVANRDANLELYINGILDNWIDISSFSSSNWVALQDFRVLAYGGAGDNLPAGQIPSRNTKIWNIRIKIGSEEVFFPLQGSPYDVEPLGKHLTVNTGFVNFWQRQNTFHYNLEHGYDRYLLDGVSPVPEENYVLVPWVNGDPVVASVAGYTKVKSVPPRAIAPTTNAYNFDKSNVNIWSAGVRTRDDYDSAQPLDWSGWELSAFNLTEDSTGLDAENKIFSASLDNEYVYLDGQPTFDNVTGTPFVIDLSPLESVQSILSYETTRTQSRMRRIINFFKQLVGV